MPRSRVTWPGSASFQQASSNRVSRPHAPLSTKSPVHDKASHEKVTDMFTVIYEPKQGYGVETQVDKHRAEALFLTKVACHHWDMN